MRLAAYASRGRVEKTHYVSVPTAFHLLRAARRRTDRRHRFTYLFGLGLLYGPRWQARSADHSSGRGRTDREAEDRGQAAAAAAEARGGQAVRASARVRRHSAGGA